MSTQVDLIVSAAIDSMSAEDCEKYGYDAATTTNHPLTAKITGLSVIALVSNATGVRGMQSTHVGGDCVQKLFREVHKFLRQGSSDYLQVRWYGEDIDLIRKTAWKTCVQSGEFEDDRIDAELLYAATNFDVMSILEQKARWKNSPSVSFDDAIGILFGDTDPYYMEYLRAIDSSSTSSQESQLAACCTFYYQLFVRSSRVPLVALASPSTAKVKALVKKKVLTKAKAKRKVAKRPVPAAQSS